MELNSDQSTPFEPKSGREAQIIRALRGRYHFINRLGKGAMATVYGVVNNSLDRIEALKVLSDNLTRNRDFLERFKVEAKICASFEHPNIVTIYDNNSVSRYYYYSMFYVDGHPMTQYVKSSERMPDPRIFKNFETICAAIHYAHERGVIHRDIKASNIMLDRHGKPYITDFGIARWEKSVHKTQSGVIMGSPHYVSPEQIENTKIDRRADIFSLGVTLYVLLTQRYPFQAKSAMAVIAKKLSHEPDPIEMYRPDLSPELKEIIDRAIQPDPANRYQTAEEMGKHIAAVLGASTVTESTPVLWKNASKVAIDTGTPGPKISLPRLKLLVTLGLVTLAIAVMVYTLHPFKNKRGADPSHAADATPPSMATADPNSAPPKKRFPVPENLDDSNSEPVTANDGSEGSAGIAETRQSPEELALDAPSKAQDAVRLLKRELKVALDRLRKKCHDGNDDDCMQDADSVLKNLNRRSVEQKNAVSDLQREIQSFRNLAQKRLYHKKLDREVDRRVGIMERHCQGDELAACMDAAASVNRVIGRLPEKLQKRYVKIKQQADRYHARADRKTQTEKRLLVEMERIKVKVGQGDLQSAVELIDAMLNQDRLSPDFKAELRLQRKKIEQLR